MAFTFTEKKGAEVGFVLQPCPLDCVFEELPKTREKGCNFIFSKDITIDPFSHHTDAYLTKLKEIMAN